MADRTLADYLVHEQRIADMMADPDLTGDLLLIGIALARHLDVDHGGEGDTELLRLARTVFPADTAENRIVVALRADIRRYAIPGFGQRATCDAPMVTRDRCGKPASSGTFVVDVATGEEDRVSACGQRDHRDWWRVQSRAAKAAREAAGDTIPRPYANTGGVLRRHLPTIDWALMWTHLDPAWEPYPELPADVARLQLVSVATTPAVIVNGEPAEHPRPPLRLV